ncbi:hypothetical protein J4218_04970 [Candidatus Pacearchaeota archaeon]|nr:hypothetical protein [Candidatus Pacearchaeota archaeon]
MDYSITQILALIFIVIASIKLLVILIKPSAWLKIVKKVWKNSTHVMIVCLVFVALVLYLLILDGITIIQIFAVMVFVSLLAGVGIAMYSDSIVNLAQRLLRDRHIVKKSWLFILIWVFLILWGLKELFM